MVRVIVRGSRSRKCKNIKKQRRETTMEKIKKFFYGIAQIIMDVIIGLAIHYCLITFVPKWNESTILVITLVATAIFAEIWEIKAK